MGSKFVEVLCDVDCEWSEKNPVYRVFVNGELFTERTWIWRNFYLEEILQIYAPPGRYPLRFELIDPNLESLSVTNVRVKEGNAKIVDSSVLEILP